MLMRVLSLLEGQIRVGSLFHSLYVNHNESVTYKGGGQEQSKGLFHINRKQWSNDPGAESRLGELPEANPAKSQQKMQSPGR